jgi:hypothetical protein
MGWMPQPGQIYHHQKDKPYQIITVAEHIETGEKLVVYQQLYGDFKTYIKSLERFLAEIASAQGEDTVQKDSKQQREEQTEKQINDAESSPREEMKQEINSILMEFLDADSYYRKLEIISSNKKHITDRLINDMAVALDCTIEEGPIDQRIQGLIVCLQAMCRFENKRLR